MAFLLISDLDHTWVGDPRAQQRLQAYLQARRREVCLVYATGRSYASARHLQAEVGLLEPDYWITAVGSEIYGPQGLDSIWAKHLSIGWQRQAIVDLATQMTGLRPQPSQEQNPWKISFYLDSPALVPVLQDLQHQLEQARLQAQIIFSSGRDVDLLPRNGNKGNASQYLRKQLGFSPQQTLVCGDSGNDISLFTGEAYGVIVNNAQAELLHWYHRHGQTHHYYAQASHAAGILEALAYFRLGGSDPQ
ncbi:sucrose-phosphate phosphatase [Synechocystis sp. LKSZ1]|uniref:sucrose-phosphate phosphatase n=1 Tax=Synechocystis sp. LKSZ1 TaxID=3144951 RepID=UPI00336BB4C8